MITWPCPAAPIDEEGLDGMKNKEFRVKLSPEFEQLAHGWGPGKCLRMARYFADFARQLEMRGRIALADQNRSKPRPSMRPLPRRRLRLN